MAPSLLVAAPGTWYIVPPLRSTSVLMLLRTSAEMRAFPGRKDTQVSSDLIEWKEKKEEQEQDA